MGRKYVTQNDIAKRAGVSRSAVSYILHGSSDKKFSDDVRKRVMDIANEMNYRPNPFGKGLKTNMSHNIALILTSLSDTSMTLLIKAIEKTALSEGYGLIIYNLEDIKEKTMNSVKTLFEKPFDGAIYCYPDRSDHALIKDMTEKLRIPIVIIGNKLDSIQLDNVRYDYYEAGKILAEHICSLNPERVAIATSGTNEKEMNFSKKLRIKGMQEVFIKNDVAFDIFLKKQSEKEKFVYFDAHEYDTGYMIGEEILGKDIKYSAVVGSNDFITAGIINSMKSKGVKIPGDIYFASFGGQLVSKIIEPKLTSIEIPIYEISESAFYILKDRIENTIENPKTEKIIKAKLIIDRSTKPIID